jgi:CHAD domain-containing protein
VIDPDTDPTRPSAERSQLVWEAFAEHRSSLASAAERVREAEDPQAIHDLRVGIRRMDAMLRTWAGFFRAGARDDALRALRRLRRRLGEARELESQVALLEPRAPQHGESAIRLLQRLKDRLARRTDRAAKRLRPKRLKRLLARMDEIAADLETSPMAKPRVFDQARERALKTGAVARIAVEVAARQEDDETLHQARLAVKKWRYMLECLETIVPEAESLITPALRAMQEALGAIQDRAALTGAIERFGRKEDRAALEGVLVELQAERRAALQEFKALAASLRTKPLREGARENAGLPPVTLPAADPSADVRWERMAQWLHGEGIEK